MRVALVLPLDDWRQCAAAAQAAEALGVDVVQCNETKHDPFAPLAIAGLATERIALATSVAIAFPRSPMIVANQAWDLERQTRGRFVLGLGSQVKGHNERRFSVPWVAPAARMGEYVESLRAIWRSWETGAKLDYQGKHYRFSLMNEEFSPGPNHLPMVPVTIAAVGPLMLKTAARLCDGVRLHLFATRKYIEETAEPILAAGLDGRGMARENFEVSGGGFVVSGPDSRAVAASLERTRHRVAFYASTPAYRPVLDAHGLGELGQRLFEMSRRGEFSRMAPLVSDEVLELFVASGTYDELPAAIERRFGGIVDTVTLDLAPGGDRKTALKLVDAIHRIPSRFERFKTQASQP
ncbi:MAG TPA: TIGR03617 family F420-dependent LLM class oxidoreductase [Alphaproteobacteria bacterium]|nr:TIGR03617 family F420-dependent LLM class oxidoreductase [Alphaproteobacteria bacterium]